MLKQIVKSLLRRLDLDVRSMKYVTSEETALSSVLRAVSPLAVLDVGANTGQFARLVRKVGYTGRLVSFEALPDVHALLLEASRGDPNWLVAPCAALGRAAGKVEIHVAKNSVSSSLLPMSSRHIEAAPDSIYVGTQQTRMERLDVLSAELLPSAGPLFLKIDTQGYEQEVLMGATDLLDRTLAMQVEMSLVPLYTGAPSLTQMISYIENLGYEIFSIVPGFKDLTTGRLLQVEGFFVRQ